MPLTPRELATAREVLLVRKLLIVFSELRDRLLDGLARAGFPDVTLQHSQVLRHMQVEGITMAEIARRAGVSRQAIAGIAHDLEARGYVSIKPHPTDARKLELRFTRRGEKLAAATIRVAAAIDIDLERILGAGTKQLRRQLDRLYAALV